MCAAACQEKPTNMGAIYDLEDTLAFQSCAAIYLVCMQRERKRARFHACRGKSRYHREVSMCTTLSVQGPKGVD